MAHPTAIRRPRLLYASVLVLTLMQVTLVIDTSVVNVALPVIRDELGFSAAGLSWVVTSYALVFGGLVLVSGRVGSIIGRCSCCRSGWAPGSAWFWAAH